MLDSLLRRGYFPKELPPSFHTFDFANVLTTSTPPNVFDLDTGGKPSRRYTSLCAQHSLTRPGGSKRRLQVPNPINYHQLASLLDKNWQAIIAHCNQSSSSLSSPQIDLNRRRGIIGAKWNTNAFANSASLRAGMTHVIRADIAACYNSIYTHSIPWAIHGKTASKSNRKFSWDANGLYGNDLDLAVRNSQDAQTSGIPISPDTSLVICELIGSVVDKKLQDEGFVFSRRIDDFEIAVSTRRAAEAVIDTLDDILSDFELFLNPKKTEIFELPIAIGTPWLHTLRDFAFNPKSERSEAKSFEKYFQLLFSLKSAYSSEHVLSYGIPRFARQKVWPANASMLHNLLLQCAAAEPSCLRFVLGVLEQHEIAGLTVARDRLQAVLNDMLVHSVSSGRGNEIAWCLWGLMYFGHKLSTQAENASASIKDPFALLMAVDAHHSGLCNLDLGSVIVFGSGDQLNDSMWPFVYEAGRRGWIPNSNPGFIDADDGFKYLRSSGVEFYEQFSKAGARALRPKRGPSENLQEILRGWSSLIGYRQTT